MNDEIKDWLDRGLAAQVAVNEILATRERLDGVPLDGAKFDGVPINPVKIEIRAVKDPAGRAAVLLQLPDGYVTLLPKDAVLIADMLLDTAVEIQADGGS